ncbi:VOC family protein [Leuconostoc rapi]|uniref:VOC family protein n=1 Tax=Leuconostoc rapi TaxID=1406906 RepID=UPI00195914F6|nr:VOC family protein [Leuconostoc rapi]MBM7436155.1 catechol 2,3-dioxygenase-like lactoylglutathione lyase family enzyme [Leuconostoc rapi]
MVLVDWDHTMINVPELAKSIDFFANEGVIFKLGGQHENWGTANALGYFGINYIELINVFDQQKANLIDHDIATAVYDAVQDFNQERQRFNTIALRTNDLENVRERLELAGIGVGPILEGKRRNEQNKLITWRIFFINDDIDGLPYPFFIDWQTSDQDREQQLIEQELIQTHPIGALKVVKAVFEVNNPLKVSQQWANLIDRVATEEHGEFIVPIGERTLEFVAGPANHLISLHFSGANHQQTINLGEAQLVFD